MSRDAAAAGVARAQAAISRPPTHRSASFNPEHCRPLQSEGYAGRGEVTVLSDGAEIMKRLPKALPRPTTHIIDWFHIAMKIQPLQQIADHVVRWSEAGNSEMAHVDADVQSLKWKLWHGQTDRALDQLETMTGEFTNLRERGNLSATRLLHLAHPLLAYVRSNKSAIINYGARYRSGRRVARALAESAVNSLVARRMVKKQQMQWSKRGTPIFCFRFEPPFSTAIFGSASRTGRRNKPIDPGLRACSNRHRR